MGMCLGIYLIYGAIYWRINLPSMYTFFHTFPLIRFVEMASGMLLARLYYLNNAKPRRFVISDIPLLNDGIILVVLAGIFFNVMYVRQNPSLIIQWVSYRLIMPPLYAVLLYRFARGNGFIAGFFGLSFVRSLGKSSFYPYLLHIPLMGWLCWILEYYVGYKKFLHRPFNIFVFMLIMYLGSYLFWKHKSKTKKKTYRPEDHVTPPKSPAKGLREI
jgi:peptidoglycan/LPS O-acetylase OafA/YrhL